MTVMGRRPKKLANVVPTTAFVCTHVANRERALSAYRDEPIVSNDTGWQFTCGRSRERGEPEMMIVDELLERDPSLRELLKRAVGTAMTRSSADEPWTEVRDTP